MKISCLYLYMVLLLCMILLCITSSNANSIKLGALRGYRTYYEARVFAKASGKQINSIKSALNITRSEIPKVRRKFSTRQRKMIFMSTIVEARDVQKEVDRAYPLSTDKNILIKRKILAHHLLELSARAICKQYHISRSEGSAIMMDGTEQGWH